MYATTATMAMATMTIGMACLLRGRLRNDVVTMGMEEGHKSRKAVEASTALRG